MNLRRCLQYREGEKDRKEYRFGFTECGDGLFVARDSGICAGVSGRRGASEREFRDVPENS